MKYHSSKFLAAFLLVFLLAAVMFHFPAGTPNASEPPYVFETETPERPEKLSEASESFLSQFNAALVNLADIAKPTVVMVSTERTVRSRSGGSIFEDFFRPFQDDPFFRDHPFFRDRGPREREYQQRGLGSGVIVSDDGYILTNHHVIANVDTITVTLINNKQLPASVVGSDPRTDVAVLKVNAESLPFMSFGDSDELQVGEMVMAIGSPLGAALAHTVTKGIVSAKGRSELNILGEGGFENFIQTDAAINRGNSGGPLINMKAQLIGINTAIASQSGGFQGIGFAIPSNMAKMVMESIIEKGRVVRGFIGINFQPVDENLARALELPETRGVLITDVVEDSPAKDAGIQVEDVIVAFNGRQIKAISDFQRRVAETMPGTKISLTIYRDGEKKEIALVLAEYPTDEIAVADKETIKDMVGFSVTELTRELAERLRIRQNIQGVVVDEVDRNSPAGRNGLRQGDVIVTMNRQITASVSDFNSVLSKIDPGESILLQVVRGNNRFYIAFELQSS